MKVPQTLSMQVGFDQVFQGFGIFKLILFRIFLAIFLFIGLFEMAAAESCFPPTRPLLPSDRQAVREFANVLRNDFELYIRDVQSYFRCLEEERARAFEEAREVSQEYGRFLQIVDE